MEEILFSEGSNTGEFEQELDELWYVPQQHEVNNGYYKTLHRTNALMVPFLWNQKFLHEKTVEIESGFRKNIYKKGWQYDNTKEKKIIGIMEPNLNIVKFCLIPTMIVEECYRGLVGKNYIDKLRITNATKLKEDKLFMSFIKTFDLFKDDKISAEARYQTAYVLTQHLDILVCHQILNPLNYLYLDAVYLGYPVLHNAYMCADLGYYYEGSDTIEGAKMLSYILENHDKNLDSYNEKNDLVLQRYHTENENIIEAYDTLIENLWKGGNSEMVYNYKTNLYDECQV